MMRRLLDALGAFRRGETRIAPAGVRGRVYAKKDGDGGAIHAKTKLVATMTMRVYRKEENCWYRQNAKTGAWEKE